jgi:hypothetical protein
MNAVMSTIEEKCERVIKNKIRCGGPSAFVEILNKMIREYRKKFGLGSYQILKLDDVCMSLARAEFVGGKVILFGYETIIDNYESNFDFDNELHIIIETKEVRRIVESIMIRMLISIKMLTAA